MALKEFCQTLHECIEKLEEEIRHDINEFHNTFFAKNMDETKLALERAKEYHYKEIIDAVSEITKYVKIIIFHQDKIQWLSNHKDFSTTDLKRFSYVKRQVYAFSKKQDIHKLSKSEENIAISDQSSKRERRRRVSEVSIGTLESWKNYMEQKQKDESQTKESIKEAKTNIPKRTWSNARPRKKCISSTLGYFLEDEEERSENLKAILEDESMNEGVVHNVCGENPIACKHRELNEDNRSQEDNNTAMEEADRVNPELKNNAPVIGECTADSSTVSTDVACDNIAHKGSDSMKEEKEVENEIKNNFFHENGNKEVEIENTVSRSCESNGHVKPRIVDVVYKKKGEPLLKDAALPD